VLNSVNVSATLLIDRVRQSRSGTLSKASAIVGEHLNDFPNFVANDSRGKALPAYLIGLAQALEHERAQQMNELALLVKNIQHIKDTVSMQQNFAKVSGVIESLDSAEIVEDALQINYAALVRHDIQLIRNFEEVPWVQVDKHKVLQILINLIRNAKYALVEAQCERKGLRISIAAHRNFVRIAVADNGIGIAPENLTRIFCHGFTTKRDGHGFGLHSGALAAKEMGGALFAESLGPGKGATFMLDLPTDDPKNNIRPRIHSANSLVSC
jgi:C4-dicarboxylate-specific signal transduction histidine kinase